MSTFQIDVIETCSKTRKGETKPPKRNDRNNRNETKQNWSTAGSCRCDAQTIHPLCFEWSVVIMIVIRTLVLLLQFSSDISQNLLILQGKLMEQNRTNFSIGLNRTLSNSISQLASIVFGRSNKIEHGLFLCAFDYQTNRTQSDFTVRFCSIMSGNRTHPA